MYIKEVKIQNIRSIENLEMKFEEGKEAGWHVLLGDNGTGKSSIVRAIALGLIGPKEIPVLRLDYSDFVKKNTDMAEIVIIPYKHESDTRVGQGRTGSPDTSVHLNFIRENGKFNLIDKSNQDYVYNYIWGGGYGWFSCSFGPFRRLTGGDLTWNRAFNSYPSAGSHLSIFGEAIALTEALDWLRDLDYKRKDKKDEESQIIDNLIQFINKSQLLPHNVFLNDINSDGIFFMDSNKNEIEVFNLSDGFRTILSLAFELIRQLCNNFGSSIVFSNIASTTPFIDLPGVILIDEVDAHLHPTWQTRIGDWFTTYFPQMQFIVTTHSPLICRGAKKGTIWKLPNPGEKGNVEQVLGLDKDKLVYGDILDAYSTEAFGKNIERGEVGKEKLKQFSLLSQKKAYGGELTKEELEEYNNLKGVFSNDAVF
ncbi:MAG TPA: AAA family ATPase [Leptospiraceae bacterium]|nr:AAA family ATPase [Leptospiraceae bacterium]HRG74923.1 AAA family ATPase [Leptospiraceae bacterium]